jgi:glycine/serine hydroxymethyltransferase
MPKTMKKQSVEEWLDSIDVSTVEVRDGTHMRAIAAARIALDEAELRLSQAVENAKSAGETWNAIGVALGTSRQAAHRKFGP